MQTSDTPNSLAPSGLQSPQPTHSLISTRVTLIALACILLGTAAFASLGSSLAWGTFTIIERWITPGGFATLYIVSAFGLGTGLSRLTQGKRFSNVVHLSGLVHIALGLAALLTLSHAAGALGLLNRHSGPFIAWVLLTPGLALTVFHSRKSMAALRAQPTADTHAHANTFFLTTRYAIPGAIAAGVLLAAACLPPGVVWRSEFGGFDSLSYHLQLPKEWLLTGRIETLPHNVYSGLPSYLEAAFKHLAWLRAPSFTAAAPGILDDSGMSLIAAQQLHALLALLACVAAARVAYGIATRLNADDPRAAAGLTFSLLLLTPWTLVTGSLSYNEQGVALFAACIALVLLSETAPIIRTVLIALFVGIAASIKPTAILFVGVPAALILLAQLRREQPAIIAKALVLGTLIGTLTLAPWMLRNAAATGNPVFPFAASLFANDQQGTGWWNEEQVARFKQSHTFTGSLAERAKLTIFPDNNDPVRPSWRGITNPQWGLLIIAGLLATATCCVISHRRDRTARSIATFIFITLVAQFLLWLFATHIQSRFLLPLALPCALALATLLALTRSAPPRALLAIALLLIQSTFFIRALIIENEHGPASALLVLPTDFAGLPADTRIPADQLAPQAFVNRELPKDARVLLIGDAAPLYFARPTLYSTTYDINPLFTLPNAKHDDASTWTPALRTAGITHVLINLGELDRYRRSNFLDPRLDMGRVQTWATELGKPIMTWGNGIALFELNR